MIKIKYCVDIDRSVLISNFEKREWIHVGPEDEWNFYWTSIHTCRCLFNADKNYRLKDNQIINHFPNHYELGRKDLLIRNIRRYRREMLKSGTSIAKCIRGTFLYLDFIPTTYVLPVDYHLFLEEYRRNPSTWIVKPCGKSQGAGIFLIDKLSQLKKWSKKKKYPRNSSITKETYIISRYIENPLLISGKKFDLRLYVLVTSFHPLKAYLFKFGFCRFCSVKYNSHVTDINCLFAHLTNVSVQKEGDDYNSIHGGKWPTKNLKLYLASTRGEERTQKLFDDISWIIIHSLKAVRSVMSHDTHCFECYGYDIIVDQDLKPWLIEVNSSPSLTCTTSSDQLLKSKLIDSIVSVVLPPSGIPNCRWDKNPSPESLVNFDVLIDELQ
ncbi:polyglutamylase complex subunit TTLL1-like [Aphis gossypii]|uniref:Polyglutamylase complex subunit TTLL1 n=1 Tax=Aphis gossypii TaxID=80765 RepID=A0A9P0NT97_APHGO|nr:polyglutamylase complex subunit TTLL1-like [Aphis gossypii]CAH1738759.1 unnamed protein product [Aphis gossypii]